MAGPSQQDRPLTVRRHPDAVVGMAALTTWASRPASTVSVGPPAKKGPTPV
jgi:hypothetical protein